MISVAQCTPNIGVGGLGQALRKLCASLAARGNSVRLHVLEPEGAPRENVEIHWHPRGKFLKALGLSPSMLRALREEAGGRADVIHANSLWTMASVYPARAVRGTKCHFVFSPHGTLAPWALDHHKWRKKVFWSLMQRAAIARADCFHVSSEKELDNVRLLGFKNCVAIVPNGVDIPPLVLPKKKSRAPRRLLFLGRVHPVKALDRLLESWRMLQKRFPDWELVVAGEDDGGYLATLKALASEKKLERISFPGLVREDERDAVYQSAELFVLPSHTENFGIAVAEALANGVPVVASKFTPWKNLEREGCGWWTGTEPAILAECLAGAMAQSQESLDGMGVRGRDWMTREFSWARAAEMTEQTYAWLLGGGNAPGFVA